MPSPGDSFGRYELESLLGQGGMGQVFRANDTVLRRKVALKLVLDPDGDSESKARLLREARAAAAIDHANVVHVYDVGEHDGVLFIAMELVDGMSLRLRLAADPAPTQAELVRWLIEIAKALGAAHELGLVHRDVKPDNVMIRKDGRATMLDFGIARRVASAEEDHLGGVTGRGIVIGTPLYMAPEQLLGEVPDGRADQFAWGVMAYECLSGVLPFGTGEDAARFIANVMANDPAPLPASVPSEIADAVLRTLRKDRNARFGSMDDVVRALGATAGQVVVTPPSRLPISLAPTEAVAPSPSHAPESFARTERAPSRGRKWVTPAVLAAALVLGGGFGLRHYFAKATPAVVPAPSATTLLDLPLPRSQNPVALSAYKSAIQNLHDADYGMAVANLTRASELDPGMALAHLRIVLVRVGFMWTPDVIVTRAAYDKAFALRKDLEPRDLAVLEAIEPAIRDVPAWDEAATRIEAVRDRYPLDAELWMLAGYYRWQGGHVDDSLVDVKRATEIDPTYADAWQAVASSTLTATGDAAAATAALDRCLAIAPRSADCLRDRASIDDDRGDCAALDVDAKTGGFQDLRAAALYALRKSPDTIEEVLAAAPPASAARTPNELRARLDFIQGRFAAAETRTREWIASVSGDPNVELHARPTRLLVQLLVETGRDDEASNVAGDYLRRKDTWIGPPNPATAELLGIQRAHGDLGETEWRAAIVALDAHGILSSRRDPGEFWALTHGFVTDETGARAAAKELDALGPHPFAYDRNREIYQGAAGRILVLAGRPKDGIALLRKATTRCEGLLYPFEQTRAWLWLGNALAAEHDDANACAAYRVVLERWGAAKPKSVTADEARARMKSLACSG